MDGSQDVLDGLQDEVVIIYIGPQGHGGAIRAIRRLTTLFASHGVDVSVISFDLDAASDIAALESSSDEPADNRPSIEHSVLRMLRSFSSLVALLRQVRGAVRSRPDAVILPFLTGTALVTLAATIGLPNRVVVCERTDVSRHRVGWHVRLLRRLLYPRAAAITVNSSNPAASNLLRKISRGRPVHVVSNPHPRDMLPADPANSRIILAVGRLVEQKRHATLIEAFARIADRIPEWSVVIVGEGPLRSDLEAQIERLGLTDRVTLAGQVDDPRPYYASAGLFVLPSDYEGTSNALLEAASAGLPCLLNAEIAPPESSGTLLTSPVDSPTRLGDVIVHACSDAKVRRVYGEAARHWVSSPTDTEILSSWRIAVSLDIRPASDDATCQ